MGIQESCCARRGADYHIASKRRATSFHDDFQGVNGVWQDKVRTPPVQYDYIGGGDLSLLQ